MRAIQKSQKLTMSTGDGIIIPIELSHITILNQGTNTKIYLDRPIKPLHILIGVFYLPVYLLPCQAYPY